MKRELIQWNAARKFQITLGTLLTAGIITVALLPDNSGGKMREEERTVYFTHEDFSTPLFGSAAFWKGIQKRSLAFAQVAAFELCPAHLYDKREMDTVMRVTKNFFTTSGVKFVVRGPALEAGNGLAYISREYWARQFGGRVDIVGQTFNYNRRIYCVAGVIDESSVVGGSADAWVLLDSRDLREGEHNARFRFIARLEKGATWQEAQSELESFVKQQLEEVGGDEEGPRTVRIAPAGKRRVLDTLVFAEPVESMAIASTY